MWRSSPACGMDLSSPTAKIYSFITRLLKKSPYKIICAHQRFSENIYEFVQRNSRKKERDHQPPCLLLPLVTVAAVLRKEENCWSGFLFPYRRSIAYVTEPNTKGSSLGAHECAELSPGSLFPGLPGKLTAREGDSEDRPAVFQ